MKINFKNVIKNIIFRFNDDDVMALSAQLAYSLILAFFPFLIFLSTLIGYSNLNSTEIIGGLSRILPTEAFKLVERTLKDIMVNKSIGLLSFGIIVSIWTASSGFNAVIKGLNKAYDEPEKRSFFKVQLVAVLFTIAVAFIIFISVLLLIFGEINGKLISRKIGLGNFYRFWNLLRYVGVLLIMTLIFIILYKFTPSRKLTFKEVLPGAIFTTAFWVISSLIFSFYVNNFGNYSRLYGSLGAVIILITWLFLISLILLLGGELNASIIYEKKKIKCS